MRYAVRYFRESTPEPASLGVPTLFMVVKLPKVPSPERVWSLVCDHAARHSWTARGDGEAVRFLDGEAGAAQDLLDVEGTGGDCDVLCMKLRD